MTYSQPKLGLQAIRLPQLHDVVRPAKQARGVCNQTCVLNKSFSEIAKPLLCHVSDTARESNPDVVEDQVAVEL